MYAKSPFGLMNTGETFQRDMDIAYADEKDKFSIIYLDDITVYSATDEEHIKHLKGFREMQKIWHIIEPQKVKLCHGRREALRAYHF